MADSRPSDEAVHSEATPARWPVSEQAFVSVLFDAEPRDGGQKAEQPDFFVDLNLDQVVGAITAGRAAYKLEPFLHATLTDPDAVVYRHEVMHDLENAAVHEAVTAFAKSMHEVRVRLNGVAKRYYPRQKERWLLDAATLYVSTLEALSTTLPKLPLNSRGMRRVRDYLARYVGSEPFLTLKRETGDINAGLAEVQYSMHIGDGGIRVRRFDGTPDYSAEVLAHFERFRQGQVEVEKKKRTASPDMNHIEAAVLDMVAQLYPALFAELDRFYGSRQNFTDPVIARFDREVQFYMGFIDFRQRFEEAGLAFCYPEVKRGDKAVRSVEGFDLALATKLLKDGKTVVCNDFYLEGAERVFVVSGPNQGGKTTFARTFGQLHYLACLGFPVPGREAKLLLFDRLFTHFEREEDIQNRRGKLQDDLVRIHAILDAATADSVIIMNEIFTSTALEDALFLSERILRRVMALDALAVCVTFIDELTTLGPQTVSVLSTVVPENPAERTFKIERCKADGRAYALAIAQKYRLTYDDLKERFAS